MCACRRSCADDGVDLRGIRATVGRVRQRQRPCHRSVRRRRRRRTGHGPSDQTNVDGDDRDRPARGGFVFPTCGSARTRSRSRQQGFQDAIRAPHADGRRRVRAAGDAQRRRLDTSVTVTGEATVLEAARSQIAGTVSEAEVRSLPLNGRNFLELALLVPGVSPTNVAQHAALSGDVGRSGRQPVGRQPAQPLEQLHRRRAVGQRRCRGAERHHLRRRRGRAVSGGHVGRAGRARTRARRLRQRRDQERHERAARHRSTTTCATIAFNAKNALSGTTLPMGQSQYRRQRRRPDRRESHVLFRERRAAPARSDRARRPSPIANVARHQRATGCGRLSGPAGRDGRLSESGGLDERARQGRSSGQRPRSVRAFATASTTSSADNSRGAGGLNAPSASSGLDNRDQTIALSNTLTLSPRTVLETRAQFAHSDLQAPPTDPIGPAVSIAGVASFGTQLGQSDAPREHAVPGRQQPVASGRRARASRRRRLPLQRRPDHLSARRARQLHVLVAGELPGRRLQQRRLHADVRRHRGLADQSERRRLRCRTSGRSARGSR